MNNRNRNKLQHQVCIMFKSQEQYNEFDDYCDENGLVKGTFLRDAIFEKIVKDNMLRSKRA